MLLATYGTLMRDFPAHGMMEEGRRTKFLGQFKVKGSIYDLGAFPGFKETETGEVAVEVYEVISEGKELVEALDYFEGYSQNRPEGSFYLRKELNLIDDGRKVSMYVFNRAVSENQKVASGSWRQHVGKGGRLQLIP